MLPEYTDPPPNRLRPVGIAVALGFAGACLLTCILVAFLTATGYIRNPINLQSEGTTVQPQDEATPTRAQGRATRTLRPSTRTTPIATDEPFPTSDVATATPENLEPTATITPERTARYVASNARGVLYYYCITDSQWNLIPAVNRVWSDDPAPFIARGLKLHAPCKEG